MTMDRSQYNYEGFHGFESICDLEIRDNIVVFYEREDNKGTSVTNRIEYLAEKVCRDFFLNPNNITIFECYHEKEYSHVIFQKPLFRNPTWKRITTEDFKRNVITE